MITGYNPAQDEIIQALIAEAEADPDVIGLVLSGSRALGTVNPESDYDVFFVVSDEAYARYDQTKIIPDRAAFLKIKGGKNDIWHESPSSLQLEKIVKWMLPVYAEARVLYDRSGETSRLIDSLRRIPVDQVQAQIENWYDTYLNGLYRSLKCWRWGNEIGGRLESARSADDLVSLLFALERRWRPYSSRLVYHLEHLASQGWQPGEITAILIDLISTGNPNRQQVVGRRVVGLLETRGFGYVYDSWEGQIDQVLGWRFPG